MDRLTIQKEEELNKVIPKEFPKECRQAYTSDDMSLTASSLKVVFREDAVYELFHHIGWGRRTRENQTEQGGILTGYFCECTEEDSEDAQPWVEVCHCIPCRRPEESRPDFIYLSPDNWRDMYRIFDEMNAGRTEPYLVLGWYHTHPNTIPPLFSNLDIRTHGTQFTYPFQIGAVFNPHRKKWNVYYGPECSLGRGYLLRAALSQTRNDKEPGRITAYKEGEICTETLYGNDSREVAYTYSGYLLEPGFMGVGYRCNPVECNWEQSFLDSISRVCAAMDNDLTTLGEMDEDLCGLMTVGWTDTKPVSRIAYFEQTVYIHDVREDLLSYDTVRQQRGKTGILIWNEGRHPVLNEKHLVGLILQWGLQHLIICKAEQKNWMRTYHFDFYVWKGRK